MKITLSEALLGFDRILLNHLDGRGIQVASPPGKAIKPGQAIVLRGEGMPVHKRTDERGNLYVMLDVEMPDEQWLQGVDRKVRALSHAFHCLPFHFVYPLTWPVTRILTSTEEGRRRTQAGHR